MDTKYTPLPVRKILATYFRIYLCVVLGMLCTLNGFSAKYLFFMKYVKVMDMSYLTRYLFAKFIVYHEFQIGVAVFCRFKIIDDC